MQIFPVDQTDETVEYVMIQGSKKRSSSAKKEQPQATFEDSWQDRC